MFVKRSLICWLIGGITILLAACQGDIINSTESVRFTPGVIIPYQTSTAAPPTPTTTTVVMPPITPQPSATPFMHSIAQGETMLGIALLYGISLEDLQAANPGVDPQFLSVGTGLIIPLSGEIQAIAPSPSPVSVRQYPPVCYPAGDGGAWCILLVENDRQVPLENITAWIGLYDLGGEIITSLTAVGPLNILRPGQSMPLSVYVNPPLPVEYMVAAELLTAIEVPAGDTRYLDWAIEVDEVDIWGDSSMAATITGRIAPTMGSSPPGQAWVVAVAYDQTGRVNGMRKWESGGPLEFSLTVYSLGGPIARVEILCEVRP